MRTLLAIIILLALGWSGWWWFNASARERALNTWLAERRADGWVADAADIRVTGFPNRVDVVVTDLALADPEAGWSWQAPEFQILSLAYKPQHVIAAWPGEQVIATPVETLRIQGDTLRGSVMFEPNARLALDRATIEIAGAEIASDLGWQARIDKAILATRQAEGSGTSFAHDISFVAEGLALPQAVAASLKVGDALPETISRLNLDATLDFDRPWDRPAIETENPALEEVAIRDLAVSWGELDLRGQGTLGVDAEGYAVGEIDLRARNWREMIDVAEATGALSSGVASAVRGGLDLFAALSGDRSSINVPLAFDDGGARLGPIPIGPAPRLARRDDQRQ